MMKHTPSPHAEAQSGAPCNAAPDADRWTALFDNIGRIALKKSEAMAAAVLDDAEAADSIDRNARILRMLMGSAEIAARMKRDNEKDKARDDDARREGAPSDEDIDALYRRVAAAVDAAEREDAGDHPPRDGRTSRPGGGQGLAERGA